ncbi:PqiC family protein [Pararhodospirillum photometricum]|uniref:Uncharacterized protein conserved in bacteria n=1 Tax=Pararhodospirillum photometricum DSM 122 TaxID=1150469 RepID=H6SP94_PARPM|nr:PqiC family protein [Pararhodospirillum photometricum]CCG09419.1 Uncharacterized protein conserved in bacteria [Pararhodospirillum photometricum DSM 122]
MTFRPFLLVSLVVALLGACAESPPRRLHVLAADFPPATGGEARVLVELLPVVFPERLNRLDLVLEPSGAPLSVRESERWAAPLPDEMRQILADALWAGLGAQDVYRAPVDPRSTRLPLLRLAVRIERFEAGDQARVEASWTVRRLPDGPPLACRRLVETPVSAPTADAAVAALGRSAGQIAILLAASLDAFTRGEGGACEAEPRR